MATESRKVGELARLGQLAFAGRGAELAGLGREDANVMSAWAALTASVVDSKFDCCVSSAYDSTTFAGLNQSVTERYLTDDPSFAFGTPLTIGRRFGGAWSPEVGYGLIDFIEPEWLTLEDDALDNEDFRTEALARRSMFGRSAPSSARSARRNRADVVAPRRAPRSMTVDSGGVADGSDWTTAAPATPRRAEAAYVQPYPKAMGNTGARFVTSAQRRLATVDAGATSVAIDGDRISMRQLGRAVESLRATSGAAASPIEAETLRARAFSRVDTETTAWSGHVPTVEADLGRATPAGRHASGTTESTRVQGNRSARRPTSRSIARTSPRSLAGWESRPSAAPLVELDGIAVSADRLPSLAAGLAVASQAFAIGRSPRSAGHTARLARGAVTPDVAGVGEVPSTTAAAQRLGRGPTGMTAPDGASVPALGGVFSPSRLESALQVVSYSPRTSAPRLGYDAVLYDASEMAWLAMETESPATIDGAQATTLQRPGRRLTAAEAATHAASTAVRARGLTLSGLVTAATPSGAARSAAGAGLPTVGGSERAQRATSDSGSWSQLEKAAATWMMADAGLDGVRPGRAAVRDLQATAATEGHGRAMLDPQRTEAAPPGAMTVDRVTEMAPASSVGYATGHALLQALYSAGTPAGRAAMASSQERRGALSVQDLVPVSNAGALSARSEFARQARSAAGDARLSPVAGESGIAQRRAGEALSLRAQLGMSLGQTHLSATTTRAELFAARQLDAGWTSPTGATTDGISLPGEVTIRPSSLASYVDDPVVYVGLEGDGASSIEPTLKHGTPRTQARARAMSPQVHAALDAVTMPLSSAASLEASLRAASGSGRRDGQSQVAGIATAQADGAGTQPWEALGRHRSFDRRTMSELSSHVSEAPGRESLLERRVGALSHEKSAPGVVSWVSTAPGFSPATASLSTGDLLGTVGSTQGAPSLGSAVSGPADARQLFYRFSGDAETTFLAGDAELGSAPLGAVAGSHVVVSKGRVTRIAPATAAAARASTIAPVQTRTVGSERSTRDERRLDDVAGTGGRPRAARSPADTTRSAVDSSQVIPGLVRSVMTPTSGFHAVSEGTSALTQLSVATASHAASLRAAHGLAVIGSELGHLPSAARGVVTRALSALGALGPRAEASAFGSAATGSSAATAIIERLTSLVGLGPSASRRVVASRLADAGVSLDELVHALGSEPLDATSTRELTTRRAMKPDAAPGRSADLSAPERAAALRRGDALAAQGTAALGSPAAVTMAATHALLGADARPASTLRTSPYFGEFAPASIRMGDALGSLRSLLASIGLTDAPDTSAAAPAERLSRLAFDAPETTWLDTSDPAGASTVPATDAVKSASARGRAATTVAAPHTRPGSPASWDASDAIVRRLGAGTSDPTERALERMTSIRPTSSEHGPEALPGASLTRDWVATTESAAPPFAERLLAASAPWEQHAGSSAAARELSLGQGSDLELLASDAQATSADGLTLGARRTSRAPSAGSSSAQAGAAATRKAGSSAAATLLGKGDRSVASGVAEGRFAEIVQLAAAQLGRASQVDGPRGFQAMGSTAIHALLRGMPTNRAVTSFLAGGIDFAHTVIDRANGAFAGLDLGVLRSLDRQAEANAENAASPSLVPGMQEWPEDMRTFLGQDDAPQGSTRAINAKVERLERRMDAAQQAYTRLRDARPAAAGPPHSLDSVDWSFVRTGAYRDVPQGADLGRLASAMVKSRDVPMADMAYVAPAAKVVAQQAQMKPANEPSASSSSSSSSAPQGSAEGEREEKVDYDSLAMKLLGRIARKSAFDKHRTGGH